MRKVGNVLRQIPPTIVQPLISVPEAASNVISGLKSQLRPGTRKEDEDKWKEEIVDWLVKWSTNGKRGCIRHLLVIWSTNAKWLCKTCFVSWLTNMKSGCIWRKKGIKDNFSAKCIKNCFHKNYALWMMLWKAILVVSKLVKVQYLYYCVLLTKSLILLMYMYNLRCAIFAKHTVCSCLLWRIVGLLEAGSIMYVITRIIESYSICFTFPWGKQTPANVVGWWASNQKNFFFHF